MTSDGSASWRRASGLARLSIVYAGRVDESLAADTVNEMRFERTSADLIVNSEWVAPVSGKMREQKLASKSGRVQGGSAV